MSKKVNVLLAVIAIVVGIGYGIMDLLSGDIYGSLICFAIIPVMLAPYLLNRLFSLEITPAFITIYTIFIFFSHFLGSIVDLYHMITGYDKIMHFLSGILTALIGLLLLVQLGYYKKTNTIFHILFIIMITLSIAVGWEFFEFTFDSLFQKDAQNVVTTGVRDTMWDMIVAFIGSVIVSLKYLKEIGNRRGIIIGFIEEVGDENGKKRR